MQIESEVTKRNSASLSVATVSSASRPQQEKSPLQLIASTFKTVREMHGLNKAEYARRVHTAEKNIGSLESATTSRLATSQTITPIINGWGQNGLGTWPSEQGPNEFRTKILDNIASYYGGGSHGLLSRWMYEAGQADFQKATGLSPAALSNYKRLEREYDFAQLAAMAKDIFALRKCQGANFWGHQRGREIRKALAEDSTNYGRPEVLEKLHQMVACAGSRVHSHSNVNEILGINIPFRDRYDLSRFRYVAWETITPLVQKLNEIGFFSPTQLQKFKADWQAGEAEQKPWCHIRLGQLAKARSISSPFIAECLGHKESSKVGSSDKVNHYLTGRHSYESLPFAQVAYLVARSEKEAEQLISEARQEIKADLVKCRLGKRCLDLYVERALWGVELTDLQKFSTTDVKKLEALNSGALQGQEEALIKYVREVGQQKLAVVLERWVARNNDENVPGFYRSILQALTVFETRDTLQVSQIRISRLVSGYEIPSLMEVQKHASKIRLTKLADPLLINWKESYAKMLCAQNYPDLARIIYSIIGSESGEPLPFLRAHACDSRENRAYLTEILRTGHLAPEHLNSLLDDLKLAKKSPTRALINDVNKSGSISSALPLWLKRFSQNPEVSAGLAILERNSKREAEQQTKETQPNFLIKQRFSRGTRSTQETRTVLELLNLAPGVTPDELISAKGPINNGLSEKLIALHEKILRMGIEPKILASLVQNTRLGYATVALKQFKHLAKTGQCNRLMGPGLIVALASETPAELAKNEQVVRAAINDKLVSAGISQPTKLMLELAYWGIDPWNELPLECEEIYQCLHSTEQQTNLFLERAQKIGEGKVQRMFVRLGQLCLPSELTDVIKLYSESLEGEQLRINAEAGFNNKTQGDFERGSKIPSLPRFKKMFSAVGITPFPCWEISCALDYADSAKARQLPSFLRLLYSNVVSGDYDYQGKTTYLDGTKNLSLLYSELENRILLDLAIFHGRSPNEAGQQFRPMKSGRMVTPNLMQDLLSWIDCPSESFRGRLLCSTNSQACSPEQALTQLHSNCDYRAPFKFESWRSLMNYVIPGIENIDPTSLGFSEPTGAELINLAYPTTETLNLSRALRGFTRQEIYQLYLKFFMSEHIGQANTFAQKLDLIENLKLSNSQLEALDLNGIFGIDTIYVNWVIGNLGINGLRDLALFEDPRKALHKMGESLMQGKVPIVAEGEFSKLLLTKVHKSRQPIPVVAINEILH